MTENTRDCIRIKRLLLIGQISVYFGLLILTLRQLWLYPAHHYPYVVVIMSIGFLPSLLALRFKPAAQPYILVINSLLLVSCVFILLQEWALSGVFILVPVYALLFQQRHIYLFSAICSIVLYTALSSLILFSENKSSMQFVVLLDMLTIFLILVFIIYYVFKDLRWRNIREARHVQTIYTLSLSVEARDPYTQGHSERVARIVRIIADRLPQLDSELAYNSGLVHDVGKLSITDSVLQKENRMTGGEYELMKTHTTIGAKLCNNLNISEEIVEGVLHHHERFDGTGYPHGLQGEEIPLIARVLSIADAIDAMCSNRSYRSALELNHVYAELDRCKGSQFDPVLVKLVQEIWREIELLYEEEGE
ncbi:HD domain-containing phosphohydrolase [Paenibacillus sp. HB172176]|uniref:HD-GYP domain-containing protein n=1 Tax=Paenibacillus sp. HB172176 TaxID=2493690 RepID=UPI001438C73D|nr:HD domain-containing phosphohydrolase [Paenibacillus sp. HB172176]